MSVRIHDGSDNSLTSTANALDVNIKSSSGGVAVTNFPVTQPVSGTVSVSNLPATQPVSGTVSVGNFPATQPVSGTVTVGNASLPVTGTFFQATQPVSASALPLPAGASTSAKQPALGVAGTPSADVISVQGVVGGIAQPVSGTVAVSNLPATQAVSGTVSVGNFPATQPVSGTVTVGNASIPVTGTFFQATQPVSVAAAVTVAQATAANLNATVTGTVSVGNFPATQTVAGTVTANAGTGNFTVAQATGTNLHTVVDSGTITAVTAITNALPGGTNNLGKINILGNAGAAVDTTVLSGAAPANAIYTVSSPTSAAAGCLTSKFINASGAAVSVKASAGNLYGFSLTNETAAVAYIEFFNIATTPTLGTTAVVFAVKLPASSNVTIPPSELGLMNFTTGIGFACTTTENGSTTASVTGMIFYQ